MYLRLSMKQELSLCHRNSGHYKNVAFLCVLFQNPNRRRVENEAHEDQELQSVV
jgi:hypothetical protein